MLHTSSSCPPLHSLLFQLNEAELMIQAADSSSITRTTYDYTLLIFTGGNGQLNLDDQSVILSTDKCYLLSPQSPIVRTTAS